MYSISHQTSLKATLCDSFGTELIGHDFLFIIKEGMQLGMGNLSSGLNNISLIATNVLMVWPGGKKAPCLSKCYELICII